MNTKLLAVTLVILSCAWVSFAAVSIALNTENKDHPGQCWESEFKKAINIGDSWQPETRCEKIYCSEGFTLDYTGCGKIQPPEGQVLVQDLAKPHPKCCPRAESDLLN